MVALVHQHVAVPTDETIDLPFTDEALNHGHIQEAIRSVLARPYLADFFG